MRHPNMCSIYWKWCKKNDKWEYVCARPNWRQTHVPPSSHPCRDSEWAYATWKLNNKQFEIQLIIIIPYNLEESKRARSNHLDSPSQCRMHLLAVAACCHLVSTQQLTDTYHARCSMLELIHIIIHTNSAERRQWTYGGIRLATDGGRMNFDVSFSQFRLQ